MIRIIDYQSLSAIIDRFVADRRQTLHYHLLIILNRSMAIGHRFCTTDPDHKF